jgi:hypothetical protein
MMAECPWDGNPVAKPGFTCNIECYASFIIARGGLGKVDGLLLIGDEEAPPISLKEQPWYLQEYDKEARPWYS